MKQLVFTLALCAATVFASAQVRYVVQGGTGNGTSWSNASGDLQEMINQSNPGEQVWVAKGTYVPERRGDDPFGGYDPNSSRCTFVIHEGVELYGGFAGGEGQLVQRNIVNNPTILDGRNRYYHVACIVGVNNAVLDGFRIRNGVTSNIGQLVDAYMLINGNLIGDNVGAGIVVYSADNVRLKNLIIQDNRAVHGAGINMQYSSSCLLQNIILHDNFAYNDGGGMSIAVSDPTFVNVLIHDNKADFYPVWTGPGLRADGGGLFLEGAYPTFINVTMVDNTAVTDGDGIYSVNSNSIFYNSIIWNIIDIGVPHQNGLDLRFHHSLAMGLNPGGTNLSGGTNPNWNMSSYQLNPGSPCIDFGNQNFVNQYTQVDLAGKYRIAGGNVDLGVYEFRSNPAPPDIVNAKSMLWNNDNTLAEAIITEDMALSIYPNPAIRGQEISIDLKGDFLYYEKQVHISLYSIDGKLLYNSTHPNGNIQTNLPELPSGLYLLHLQTQDGERYSQKLFISK